MEDEEVRQGDKVWGSRAWSQMWRQYKSVVLFRYIPSTKYMYNDM